MKRTWDVIIVGGGIMGCAAAYYAARAGLSVLLFERDTPGSAQSGRNLGFVRQQGRDLRELPLAIGAAQLWQEIERDLGRKLGWAQCGYLALAMSEKELERQEAWRKEALSHGLDTRILSATDVRSHLPDLAPDVGVKGAMFTVSDGQAEPNRATRAYFDVALEQGAEAVLGHRVARIETAAGRANGVWSNGKFYGASTIICTAGAGSARLLRPLGILLPQEIIRATVARTEPLSAAFPCCVSCPMTGMRQARDGAMILSVAGGEYDVRLNSLRFAGWYRKARQENPNASRINFLAPFRRILSHGAPPPIADISPSSDCVPPEPKRIHQAYDEFAKFFPALAGIEITASWAGYIDTLPDMVPALGEVQKVPGLIVATGFSGHGFGLGPMVGNLLTRLVKNEAPGVDVGPLSPERFSPK